MCKWAMCKWAKIAETCMAAFPADACSYAAAIRMQYVVERVTSNLRRGRNRREAYRDLRKRLHVYEKALKERTLETQWPRNVAPIRTHMPVWRGRLAVGRSSFLDESSVDRFVSPYQVKLIREAFPHLEIR